MHKEIGMGGYIFKNGCIVTMDSERRVIPKGTVAVLDGEILWAGEECGMQGRRLFQRSNSRRLTARGNVSFRDLLIAEDMQVLAISTI